MPKRRGKSQSDAQAVFRNGEYHLAGPQLRALIEAAVSSRDRCIVQLFAETGIRRGELAALNAADVVSDQSLAIVRRGKGGKMRMLPLTRTLRQGLDTLQGPRFAGALFTSRAGARLSVRQINRIVSEAGRRAGIVNPNPRHNRITCHLLRHSFARLWKDAGGSIETLSKILGHASVKTTMDVYGTESLADVQRNYHRLMAKLTKRSTTQQESNFIHKEEL